MKNLWLLCCAVLAAACSDIPTEPEPKPVVEPVFTRYIAVSAGADHTCAIRDDNRAFCWGATRSGRLGIGTLDTSAVTIPTPVGGDALFHKIDAGFAHTCGVAVGGIAHCWGAADNGQLANRSSIPQAEPFRIREYPFSFLDIAAGERHTCALDEAQNAFCWGLNFDGQLGNASTIDQGVPVPVVLTGRVSSIAPGRTHTCAVTITGAAWCWGRGDAGQVGNGMTPVRQTTPVAVAGGISWATVTTGGSHTCALAVSGEAWCWGEGVAGQLGNGELRNSAVPVRVNGDIKFRAISAGDEQTCAVATDGRAFCWGHNNYGRLGFVSLPAPQPAPAQVESALVFTDISAGRFHTCGLTDDGAIYCWGFGGFGQLGSGGLFAQPAPVRVAEPDSVSGSATQ